MPASDSYQLIAVLVVAVVAIVLAIGSRLWVRGHRSAANEIPTQVVLPAPTLEISERQSLWSTLSSREEEVARLAAGDWSDDEIARELCLSVRTVQNHLQHAREKLHIHSRHELKYFLQHLGDGVIAAPK